MSRDGTSIVDLDPVIHAPKRLGAMAVLSSSQVVDFGFLRDHLDISDSDLSKQMSALEKAGYVKIIKSGHGRNSTTSFRITRGGTKALRSHLTALNALMGDAATVAAAAD